MIFTSANKDNYRLRLVSSAETKTWGPISAEIILHKLTNQMSGGGKSELSHDGYSVKLIYEEEYQASHNKWGATTGTRRRFETFEITDCNGKLQKIYPFLDRARALDLKSQSNRRLFGRHYGPFIRPSGHHDEFRGFGPVEGIRKWRGGYGSCRRVRTMAEKRLNELVLYEDGEVSARTSRLGTNLVSSWDDVMRQNERNWKSQTKGIKAWDR